MKEPKIYSISTVGILKHFHQDYLLHPLRTDFTGGNGVGKSIIADLIQIIFICYEKYIKFGTEGFTKEKREIRKLPYKNTEAYAFLNIKTEEERFITIGVNIQARLGKKVHPFVVLSKPDLNSPLSELEYDSSKILTQKDFLSEQHTILPLEQLSKQLKEKHHLYLIPFHYNEDIQRYHSFLFEKELLPINLTIPEHLKAFAKVIQSFSRVKDLGLNKANILKEFLFEDDDKEFMEEYQKHKQQLDRLLTDFQELNNQIDNIERKQQVLGKLKTLEKHKNDSQFNHDLKQITELHQQYVQSRKQGKELQVQLDNKSSKKKILENREKKFQKIVPALENYYDEIETNYTLLLQYETKYKEWKQYETEIIQLRLIEYNNFSRETINNSSEVEVTKLKTEEIIKQVSTAIPLFTHYGQLSDIIHKYEEQQEKLSSLQLSAGNKLSQLNRIIKLLDDKGANSLFRQIIQRKKPLSLHQESVLMALIDLSLGKPEEVSPGLRYAQSTHILDENNFEPDESNHGVWLKLGELREFISLSKEKQIFASGSDFEHILSNKIEELNLQVTQIKQQKEELDKIKKSLPYDKNIVKEYDFDIQLIEYSTIKNLKEAAWIISNKEIKISQLLQDSSQLKSDVETIQRKLTVPVQTENLSGFIKQYETRKKLTGQRKKKVLEKSTQESTELTQIRVQIPYIEKELKQKQEEEKRLYSQYETKKQLFDSQYPDVDINIENESIKTNTLEELKMELDSANQDYISEYKSIAGNFEETKNEKSQQVNMQINGAYYQFKILEEVLLGGKIRYLDKVSDYLHEANRQRLIFVGNIRDNMVKVFTKTLRRYQYYEDLVKKLNTFFIGRKISESYYLHLKFKEYEDIKISWIDQLQTSSRWVNRPGEFSFGQSVQEFIEDLFKTITGIRRTIEFKDLLNPKTYFDLEATLTDEEKNEIPGSTGETYSALVLLGIARLSKVQDKNRNGLKFIILEELSNLDDVNFNLFPRIAEEFRYQLLTMTPKPYYSDSENGWYLYTLIKGYKDKNINYPIPASYYKTRSNRIDLENYLKTLEK